ncbi:MAG: nucleotidyltransferase family protein [Actinomycetota bacterium]
MRQEIFSIRLPHDALRRLRRMARANKTGTTQLARDWILERLAAEPAARQRSTRVAEPAARYARAHPLPLEAADEIAAVCRRRGVKRLGLFGSAARRDFDRERSDVDVTVEFLEMPSGVLADAYFGLIEDLEDLFGRSVDVVTKSSVENPYLLAAIERDEVILYDAA